MKIKAEDYKNIKETIDKVINILGIQEIKRLKNLIFSLNKEKRFRWDLFYYANRLKRQNDEDELHKTIYQYANDVHIDTALKHYVANSELLKSIE